MSESSVWYYDIDGATMRLREKGVWTDVWRRPPNDQVSGVIGVVKKRAFWTVLESAHLARPRPASPAFDGVWAQLDEQELVLYGADETCVATVGVPWQRDASVKVATFFRFAPLIEPLWVEDPEPSYRLAIGTGVRSHALLLEDTNGGDRIGLGAVLTDRLELTPLPALTGASASVWSNALLDLLLTFHGRVVLEFGNGQVVVRSDTGVVGSVAVGMTGPAFTIDSTSAMITRGIAALLSTEKAAAPTVFSLHEQGVVTMMNTTADGSAIDASASFVFRQNTSTFVMARVSSQLPGVPPQQAPPPESQWPTH